MSDQAAITESHHGVLATHREDLLSRPGVTAVALGRKEVEGKETDQLALVVFVERKKAVPEGERIPEMLERLPTDVVERSFSPRAIATNPLDRFDPMISGVAVAPAAVPSTPGSIGCFVRTTGKAGSYPAGVYLLTCEHVVHHAGQGGSVLQPDWTQPTPPPANYAIGTFLDGVLDHANDCAIVGLGGRGWRNEVPNKPLHPGNRTLRGVAPLPILVGTTVYKFGVATRYTTAQVRYVDWASANGSVTGALYLENPSHKSWVDGGDSGSVAVSTAGDLVVGLNFQADTNCPAAGGGYYAGLAYPIQSQMNNFADSGGVALA